MKGFIGPIGDDLPSVLVILMALSLFFAGLTFTLDTYNQRLDNFNKLKGIMDIARKVTSQGLFPDTTTALGLKDDAKLIAKSYGINFCVIFNSDTQCSIPGATACKDDWIRFKYLIAYNSPVKIELKELEVCAG